MGFAGEIDLIYTFGLFLGGDALAPQVRVGSGRLRRFVMDRMKTVIAVGTLLLWLSLVVLALLTVLLNWPPEQRLLSLTEKVLLPLLKLTIVAVLSYVFGQPVVNAFVQRLSREASTNPGLKGGSS